MQSLFVAFLASAAKAALPLLLPLLQQVAAILVAEFVAKAKTGALPVKYAFLAPAVAKIEEDLLKLFPVS